MGRERLDQYSVRDRERLTNSTLELLTYVIGSLSETEMTPKQQTLFRYVLRLGDLSLVLGQRLGEWVGHCPALEEDLGVANIALDLIGQARLFLTYAGEIEGRGRDEDKLAYLREQGAYFNAILVEQPNGDFGQTIVRQVLIDAFQLELYERMTASSSITGLAAATSRNRASTG